MSDSPDPPPSDTVPLIAKKGLNAWHYCWQIVVVLTLILPICVLIYSMVDPWMDTRPREEPDFLLPLQSRSISTENVSMIRLWATQRLSSTFQTDSRLDLLQVSNSRVDISMHSWNLSFSANLRNSPVWLPLHLRPAQSTESDDDSIHVSLVSANTPFYVSLKSGGEVPSFWNQSCISCHETARLSTNHSFQHSFSQDAFYGVYIGPVHPSEDVVVTGTIFLRYNVATYPTHQVFSTATVPHSGKDVNCDPPFTPEHMLVIQSRRELFEGAPVTIRAQIWGTDGVMMIIIQVILWLVIVFVVCLAYSSGIQKLLETVATFLHVKAAWLSLILTMLLFLQPCFLVFTTLEALFHFSIFEDFLLMPAHWVTAALSSLLVIYVVFVLFGVEKPRDGTGRADATQEYGVGRQIATMDRKTVLRLDFRTNDDDPVGMKFLLWWIVFFLGMLLFIFGGQNGGASAADFVLVTNHGITGFGFYLYASVAGVRRPAKPDDEETQDAALTMSFFGISLFSTIMNIVYLSRITSDVVPTGQLFCARVGLHISNFYHIVVMEYFLARNFSSLHSYTDKKITQRQSHNADFGLKDVKQAGMWLACGCYMGCFLCRIVVLDLFHLAQNQLTVVLAVGCATGFAVVALVMIYWHSVLPKKFLAEGVPLPPCVPMPRIFGAVGSFVLFSIYILEFNLTEQPSGLVSTLYLATWGFEVIFFVVFATMIEMFGAGPKSARFLGLMMVESLTFICLNVYEEFLPTPFNALPGQNEPVSIVVDIFNEYHMFVFLTCLLFLNDVRDNQLRFFRRLGQAVDNLEP